MGIFVGPMKKKLIGWKQLTKHQPVKLFQPLEVAIPLYHMNYNQYELKVQPGDIVNVGTLIALRNDALYVPFYSSVSGKVIGVKKMMAANLLQMDHLLIESDGKFTKEQIKTIINIEESSSEQIVDFVRNVGIVGCGGAGFPMYVKYKAKNIKCLIINAVECEPYITADYYNLSHYFPQFCLGLKAAIKMANVTEIVIAFKDYRDQNKAEIRQLYQNIAPNIRVSFVKDAYPLGWERTLIYALFNERYIKLPSELGYIVNNASTMVALGKALNEGYGITSKVLTVAGDGIKENCNVIVPVGSFADQILTFLDGYVGQECYLIAGGPMMGKTIPNDHFAINTYSNALTVLQKKKQPATIACLRCGRCSQFCPAGLQPVKISQAYTLKDRQTILMYNGGDCIECGTCSFVCPSKIEVTENVRRAKKMISEV